MKKLLLILTCPLLLAIGCATNSNTSQNQLQIIQTRSYKTTDVKPVMKAMLSVFQDNGFIVKTANTELGLLNAINNLDLEPGTPSASHSLLFNPGDHMGKNLCVMASVNVSKSGKECRARVNFQYSYLNDKSTEEITEQVIDENVYKTFFSEVDRRKPLSKAKL